jgi:hypothetical protein
MAGVKITDLDPLLTAASGDLLYIVDVSDTTESPQGTSKSIEVGNVLDFESGTWTPTLSSFNNAITGATLQNASYVRVGNFVTCYIRLSITFDFSSVDVGNLQFSYPIVSTSFDGGGVINGQNIYFSLNGQVDGIQMIFYSADTSLVNTGTFQAIFQYEIL